MPRGAKNFIVIVSCLSQASWFHVFPVAVFCLNFNQLFFCIHDIVMVRKLWLMSIKTMLISVPHLLRHLSPTRFVDQPDLYSQSKLSCWDWFYSKCSEPWCIMYTCMLLYRTACIVYCILSCHTWAWAQHSQT